MRLSFTRLFDGETFRGPCTVVVGDDGHILGLEPGADPAAHSGLAMPGFPNLHSHAFQRALSGLTEFAGPHSTDDFWTWRQAMYQLALSLNPDEFEAIAAQLYVEMLEVGYTAVGEFHYLHHDPDGNRYANPCEMSNRVFAAQQSTGIGLTHLPVLYISGGFSQGPSPEQRRFVHPSFSDFEETRGHMSPPPGVILGVAPHSLRAVPPEALGACQGLAGPIHIHVAEQTREVIDCERQHGARPVQWLLNNYQVDSRWCLVHATHLDDSEIVALASSGAVTGLCPTTEANLGDGVFPLQPYLRASGAWGIGSDSHATIDPMGELRMLEYGQRLTQQKRNVALPQTGGHVGSTLLSQALQGGATALGQPMGRISIGNRADIVVVDDTHPRLAGHSDDMVLDALVFGTNQTPVTDVFVGGHQWVKQGQHHHREAIRRRFDQVMSGVLSHG